MIMDPFGAVFALITIDEAHAKSPDTGRCNDGESKGPPKDGRFCWQTLVTPDIQASAAFYGDLFDWEAVEAPQGDGQNAWTMVHGGAPFAGVMTCPEGDGAAPCWGVSVSVSDVELAAAKVRGLGGELVMGPISVGTIGKTAVTTDPNGAFISLFEANLDEMMKVMATFGE